MAHLTIGDKVVQKGKAVTMIITSLPFVLENVEHIWCTYEVAPYVFNTSSFPTAELDKQAEGDT